MNYQNIYNNLIQRGKNRFNGASKKEARKVIPFYVERHRIVPGCMGGKYVEGNVAWLTPEEHFVAHQLLVRMYPANWKLVHGLHMMIIASNTQIRNNKEYGWIKNKFIEARKKQIGEMNKTHKMITNGKENKMWPKNQLLPNGFNWGRKNRKKMVFSKKVCDKCNQLVYTNGFTRHKKYCGVNKINICSLCVVCGESTNTEKRKTCKNCFLKYKSEIGKHRVGEKRPPHKWMTDGEQNKYFPTSGILPSGWRHGFTRRT